MKLGAFRKVRSGVPTRCILFFAIAAGCLTAVAPAAHRALAAAPAKPDPFESRIRPLLTARCLGCHAGPDAKGGLDLSTRAALLAAGGGAVLRPGSPAGSRLLQRVAAGTMPPQGKLPAGDIAALRDWIRSGARWTGGPLDPFARTTSTRAGLDWWSLQPLRAVPVPAGAEANPVDAFVARRLGQAGYRLAPEAEPATLIRRVTYDLHGLPPTWDEVRDYLADRRPDRYERLVERLLASPRYGERAARRWLDAARFAESDGYEHDMPRFKAWPYRDWVIDAFNRDLPYDQFVREQLAGDALRPEDPRAGIPTGFLMAGGFDSVGTKQAAPTARLEVRQDELEDMIGVTGQVLLGVTAQCARCHDHKYDPISQVDYYRLQAVFAGAFHHGAEGKHDYYGVRSAPPPATFVLRRGLVTAPEREVTPGGLSAVRALTSDLPTAPGDPARRKALAEWITDRRNPLPARAMANRVWGWVFGRALAATPNDLGFNGERPVHPELLEYLAHRFAGSLSVKELHRILVTSRAYRQARGGPRAARGEAAEPPPLHREPRRLEAEELRDTLLAVSGRLNPRSGGPGFQLFTWKSNAGALYESVEPEGPEYERRSIYRMVVRGSEVPLLTGFDCPDPSATTPRRQASTTATQALSLLNNTFVDRQSRHFAERLAAEAPTGLADQIALSYRIALGREPTSTEAAAARAHAETHSLRAWCRVLFNTSELLWVE
jgi:hypothetical protein